MMMLTKPEVVNRYVTITSWDLGGGGSTWWQRVKGMRKLCASGNEGGERVARECDERHVRDYVD